MLKKIKQILFILIFFILLNSVVSAGTEEIKIRYYKETIDIKNTGAAEVTTKIEMASYSDESLYLPLNYIWVEKIKAVIMETGESLPASIKTLDGIDYLFLDTGTTSVNEKTLEIHFRDPAYLIWKDAGPEEYEIYHYKSEFINTSRFLIEEYEMEIILPEGFVLNSIIKSNPSYSSKDPEPPYHYKNLQERSLINIKKNNLKPVQNCMIEYNFKKKSVSYTLLITGIILIILYLLFFRDVLKEGKK